MQVWLAAGLPSSLCVAISLGGLVIGEELLPYVDPLNVAWKEVAISLFHIIPAAIALGKYARVFN